MEKNLKKRLMTPKTMLIFMYLEPNILTEILRIFKEMKVFAFLSKKAITLIY